MAFLSEAAVEQALLEQLRGLGYAVASDEVIGPDGSTPERDSHDVVLLHKRLEDAVLRLNPKLPPEARADAIRKLTQSVFPALLGGCLATLRPVKAWLVAEQYVRKAGEAQWLSTGAHGKAPASYKRKGW